MRTLLISAMLTIPATSTWAAAAVGLGDQYPQACAAGYHRDRGGNCQPNVAETNRYCPPGLVIHQEFDGWSCNPPPPEAY